MGFNPQQPYDDLPALPLATRSRLHVPQWRRPNSNHSSTCPKMVGFYPCPPNMSMAWTCATPLAQFLAELRYVYRRGRRCGSPNLKILRPFRELIALYWQIGKDILTSQAEQGCVAKVTEHLSHAKRDPSPQIKGFTVSNVLYMRAFAEAWCDSLIVQQAAGQLPWTEKSFFSTGSNYLNVGLSMLKMPSNITLRLKPRATANEHSKHRGIRSRASWIDKANRVYRGEYKMIFQENRPRLVAEFTKFEKTNSENWTG